MTKVRVRSNSRRVFTTECTPSTSTSSSSGGGAAVVFDANSGLPPGVAGIVYVHDINAAEATIEGVAIPPGTRFLALVASPTTLADFTYW